MASSPQIVKHDLVPRPTGLVIGSFFHNCPTVDGVLDDWAERAAGTLWKGLAIED
ncbi:MAG: hypothetical protein OEM67_06005 [Thermoleophilia bacterium]|nr:hypothetical protein [Thermoleophilia bacterium]MDH3725616.1 hypothetical protein [Thermoleophilia bacterium]